MRIRVFNDEIDVPRDGQWHQIDVASDGTPITAKDGGPCLGIHFGVMPAPGVTPVRTWTGEINGQPITVQRGTIEPIQIRPMKHRERSTHITHWTNMVRDGLSELAPGSDSRWDRVDQWATPRWYPPPLGGCAEDLGQTGSPWVQMSLLPSMTMKHVMRATSKEGDDGEVEWEYKLTDAEEEATMNELKGLGRAGAGFKNEANTWRFYQAYGEFVFAGYRAKHAAGDPRVADCPGHRSKGGGFWPLYSAPVPYTFGSADGAYAGTAESGGPIADTAHFYIGTAAWIAGLHNNAIAADIAMMHVRAAMSAYARESSQQRAHGLMLKACGDCLMAFGTWLPDYRMELFFYIQQICDTLESLNETGGNPRNSMWTRAKPQSWAESCVSPHPKGRWGDKKFMQGMVCGGAAQAWMACKRLNDLDFEPMEWEVTTSVKKQLDVAAANYVNDYSPTIACIGGADYTDQGLRSCEYAAMGTEMGPFHKPTTNGGMNGVEQTLSAPGYAWLLLTEKYLGDYDARIRAASGRIKEWGSMMNGGAGYYGTDKSKFERWIIWLSMDALVDTLGPAVSYFTGETQGVSVYHALGHAESDKPFDPETDGPPGYEDDSEFREEAA